MSDVMLQSSAKGDWGYEIQGKGKKEQYKISFGFNTIPESHLKAIEKDPGFAALVKKGKFKVLSAGDMKRKAKAEEKETAKTDLEEVKKQVKQEVVDLKEVQATELKKLKENHNQLINSLTESKTEISNKLKELESKLPKLEVENSSLKSEIEASKKSEAKTSDLESKIKKLESESEVLKKSVKDLAGEKDQLAKKNEAYEAEVKKLQEKLRAK